MALGFERPEQLGALFIAGPEDLEQITLDVPPLDDDHPKRLSDELVPFDDLRDGYLEWMDTEVGRARFYDSDLVRSLWPEPLRSASREYFDYQDAWNRITQDDNPGVELDLPMLHRVLTRTSLESLARRLMGSDLLARPRGEDDMIAGRFGQAASAFLRAAREIRGAVAGAPPKLRDDVKRLESKLFHLAVYARCRAGELERAAALLRSRPPESETAAARRFLEQTFELDASD